MNISLLRSFPYVVHNLKFKLDNEKSKSLFRMTLKILLDRKRLALHYAKCNSQDIIVIGKKFQL